MSPQIIYALAAIGFIWTFWHLGKWLFRKIVKTCAIIDNYAAAAKNYKMMYEWAHKNQAWCSKNQIDLEALARRVKKLEQGE